MTGPSPSARVGIALAAVIAAALLPALAVLVQLAQSSDWYRPREDAISAFERRYAALRDALHDVVVVGYLAPGAPADAAARTAHLYMTRYTLAPVQVLDDADQALLVADSLPDRSRVPPGFAVRRDFGNGVQLLERSERRQP